ncbi:MAG: endonuclease III, partial [Clostridia bacterium]|nr:endonuclease III [Clostridia bacterium]
TDKRVNMVTARLFPLYPDAFAMAKLEPEALEPMIRECGLYHNKAKNIVAASRALVAQYDGKVPSTRKELMALPGVGQKTAGVVLLAAFGDDQIPVDTHVFRVSRRIGLADGNTPEKVEEQLRAILDRDIWSLGHQRAAGGDDVLRLVVIEAALADQRFQVLRLQLRHGESVRILGKEPCRDHVHPLVGALGGEDRGDQRLEGVGEVQLGLRLRVQLMKRLHHLGGATGIHGRFLPPGTCPLLYGYNYTFPSAVWSSIFRFIPNMCLVDAVGSGKF